METLQKYCLNRALTPRGFAIYFCMKRVKTFQISLSNCPEVVNVGKDRGYFAHFLLVSSVWVLPQFVAHRKEIHTGETLKISGCA